MTLKKETNISTNVIAMRGGSLMAVSVFRLDRTGVVRRRAIGLRHGSKAGVNRVLAGRLVFLLVNVTPHELSPARRNAQPQYRHLFKGDALWIKTK
ncbi:hypothetical protein FCN80_02135 [Martelella alba]|uniref:Uncharacterized protein n=1 Tax=Martelella alba TaxID=2590451 RepID=A0ABY2SWG9_9HYPH|nr:hypothetical protein FCN80_02135 [Martelella alba]